MRISYILMLIMAHNDIVTNYKPAVMEDKGPNNTTRQKSEDGRYTANGAFLGSDQEKEQELEGLNEIYPQLSENAMKRSQIGFNQNALSFDDRVSTPLLESILPQTTFAKLVASPKLTKTTSYEDHNLKIDLFLGEAAPQFAFQISDPDVKKIDLKTIKGGLGDKSFYDYPLIDFTVIKIHSRKPHVINDQVTKGFNDNYLFQVLSSKYPKPQNKDDINAAKMYLVPKNTMKRIIDSHNSDFVNMCAKHLLNLPKTEDVSASLANEAQKYDYDYDFDNTSNQRLNRHIIQTDTETIYFEQDKKTQDWSVRVEFDAMDFDGDNDIIFDEWKRN